MPLPEDLDQLFAIALRTSEIAGGGEYSRYLELRSKGLRRKSLAALRIFVADAVGWDFARRRAFVGWLADRMSEIGDERLLIPHDLLVDLLVPTIREWLSHEPESAMAHFLAAKYCRDHEGDLPPLDGLRRAIALDPHFERARLAFIYWVTGGAEYNQHELPAYLGSVAEDIRDLLEAREMVPGVRDPSSRASCAEEIDELLETARAWEAYKKSGERDFALWCRTHDAPARLLGFSAEDPTERP